MNCDPLDDAGPPFEPVTPEEFFQRGEQAFQIWWSELDPPGFSGGLELDREAARTVWSSAYEHSAACILLVYDCAWSSAGAVPWFEAELAYVVHRHHNGSMSLPNRYFFDWVAGHEHLIRREYQEYEHDADSDTLTVWIDHKGAPPPPSRPLKRTPPHSAESLQTSADKEFSKWWQQLTATATWELTGLDRDEALIVWREAFSRLWEDLEVVHDSAKASADVVSDTAALELAYIIDRFHGGRLSFTVHNAMDYWNEDRYVLERHRTDNEITLRVYCVSEDGDS